MLCGGECVSRGGVCILRESVYVERSVYVEGECVCRGGVYVKGECVSRGSVYVKGECVCCEEGSVYVVWSVVCM